MERKAYPSDISDEEWGFVAPYLTLMTEEAPQRDFSLCEVFNGLRWMVRAGGLHGVHPPARRPTQRVTQNAGLGS